MLMDLAVEILSPLAGAVPIPYMVSKMAYSLSSSVP